MKRIILLILVPLASYGFAQTIERSVFGTSGTFASTSNLSLSYTLGEVFVTTASSTGVTLTQGFQQPTNTTNPGPGSVNESITDDILVAPNPTRGYVHVTGGVEGNFSIVIFDMLGREMHNTSINNTLDVKLDLSKYNTGLYFVKIYNEETHLKTIKVKKI